MSGSKPSPDAWGGGSIALIPKEHIKSLMCCVAGCGRNGYAQWQICADGLWRPYCAEHDARMNYMGMLFQGDPDAREKWERYVEKVGAEVGYGKQDDGTYGVLGVEALPATVMSIPSEWRCSLCGGGLIGTNGFGRWSHECVPLSMQDKVNDGEGS